MRELLIFAAGIATGDLLYRGVKSSWREARARRRLRRLP